MALWDENQGEPAVHAADPGGDDGLCVVRHHHPVGAELYALAAVPTLPILAVLVVVGLYLKEEQDEFQRMVVVRSLLGAIAGLLAMSAFVDFLRSYNVLGALPPFTDFVVFWVLFGLMQAAQSAMYSAAREE
jgi:hypothetical protein